MRWARAALVALALLLAIPNGAAFARDAGAPFTVGVSTPADGHFFTDLWGNNATDQDVRALLHGYSTVSWVLDSELVIDESVVAARSAADEDNGGKTYRFTLAPGLTYADGTPITAKDYVFTVLLLSSPQLGALGVSQASWQHLAGYNVFSAGESAAFSGVRLLGDLEFSLTIASGALPSYQELALVNVAPYPPGVLAPGCDVIDEGDGAALQGPFTADLLRETILNPQTGYLYNPRITAGPYTLAGFDAATGGVTLSRNPRYRGNIAGQKPGIPAIEILPLPAAETIPALAAGRVQLVSRVTQADALAAGGELVKAGAAQATGYLRAGLNMLAFACELGPTASENIRKAVAMCVDVPQLIEDCVQGYGLPVYGYYGFGQWMAQRAGEQLIALSRYSLNLNAAQNLLAADGWVLNEKGGPFDLLKDTLRYRRGEDGSLQPLALRLAVGQGSETGAALSAMLTANGAKIGLGVQVDVLPFDDLLAYYYRQKDRTYNVFNLAVGMGPVFDPSRTFSAAQADNGLVNPFGIRDEKLEKAALTLSQTAPGDTAAYLDAWLAFQRRVVDAAPLHPLYSNLCYDFYIPQLTGYYPRANRGWAAAILYAQVHQ
ncbi:MAG: ABC transporter substrate-binding protein [Oscillospiraceae bacterium]|jgi:peptide/nickel transport system substrate-binding protein|nr:ABC transporter substrate-binding protein [Oscillospiraceae bacterium]